MFGAFGLLKKGKNGNLVCVTPGNREERPSNSLVTSVYFLVPTHKCPFSILKSRCDNEHCWSFSAAVSERAVKKGFS